MRIDSLQWLAAAEARAAARTQKLEAELNGYRADMIKESIRMGHNDLGEHHYERGDLQAAFKCFVRTRDYCTSSKHLVGMCLSVVRVSLELGNFLHVANYVQKAEATPDKDAEPGAGQARRRHGAGEPCAKEIPPGG